MVERFRPNQLTIGTADTERQLFDMSSPSGMSWQESFEIIDLPKNISDMRILDVGAGASDLVCKLLEEGADAYAVDPAYLNMSGLLGHINLVNTIYRVRYGEEVYGQRSEALERFMRSIREQPGRYKSAFASSLPFEDNYFNLVYSINSIFPYVDADFQLMTTVIKECLRVTRPGGTIQIFPFEGDADFGQGQDIFRLRSESHRKLVEWLKSNNKIEYSIARVGEANDRRLTLVKKR